VDESQIPVNTLMIYNLTPGTTTLFRDIRACNDLCPELVLPPIMNNNHGTVRLRPEDVHLYSEPFNPYEVFDNSYYLQSSCLIAAISVCFLLH
jgi:hypothetical protein